MFIRKGYLFVVEILFCLFGGNVCYVNADSNYDYGNRFYHGLFSSFFTSSIMDGYYFPNMVLFFVGILLLGIIVLIFIFLIRKQEVKDNGLENSELSQDIVKVIPDFDKEDFCKDLFLLYKELLDGWVQMDKNRVREFVSDEFYDKFCCACDGRKNIEEVIDGVYLLEYKIIKDLKVENGMDITIGFKFRCNNYLIDKTCNCILMGSRDEVYDEYAEVIFHIDNEGNKKIVDRIIGMPYFSNNSLEKNIEIAMEKKNSFYLETK